MGFLWTLIIGLVVGAIAKLLMPGKDPGGVIVTMLHRRGGCPAGGVPRPGAGLVREPR